MSDEICCCLCDCICGSLSLLGDVLCGCISHTVDKCSPSPSKAKVHISDTSFEQTSQIATPETGFSKDFDQYIDKVDQSKQSPSDSIDLDLSKDSAILTTHDVRVIFTHAPNELFMSHEVSSSRSVSTDSEIL
jgi:hypothetical protein